jgi:hypothetical protein
MFCIHSDIPN